MGTAIQRGRALGHAIGARTHCVLVLVLVLVLVPTRSHAFDQDAVISDHALTNSSTMTLGDVQRFLEERASLLAYVWQPDSAGLLKFPAELVWLAANEAGINPQTLLVMLQKEQGLVEGRTPRQSQYDWAMGYGCPDGSGCNPRFQGFGKQVRGAALQLRGYLDDLAQKGETIARWAVGRTKTTPDGFTITPKNAATAALYSYTPWRGSDAGKGGNYLFANLWARWFGAGRYPDGAVLRGPDGVEWRIRNGQREQFVSPAVRRSYAPDEKVLVVGPSDITAYRVGATVRWPNYSVLEDSAGVRWLVVDGVRRKIASAEAFRALGFNPEEVERADGQDLTAYAEGAVIVSAKDNPRGALVRDAVTGKEFLVVGDTKRPIPHPAIREARFPGMKVAARTTKELTALKLGEPLLLPDGELVTAPKYLPQAFIVSQGKRRPFVSPRVVEELGYAWTNLRVLSNDALALHPEGAPLTGGFEGDGGSAPAAAVAPAVSSQPAAPAVPWHNLSIF